jgi:hypothetical protein
MARPQPTPALKKTRPEGHAFEQVAAPAPAAEPAVVAGAPTAATPQRRNAATAATRNGGDATTGTTKAKDEVKFSIRVSPAWHRAIKLYGVENGLSIQELAVTALDEYFQREGRPPLPKLSEAE